MTTDPTAALRAWIVEHLLDGQAPDDFDDETDLIADGVMDSLGIVRVITYLEREHGVEVGDGDIVPEHFGSVRALADLIIARRKAEGDHSTQRETASHAAIAKAAHMDAYYDLGFVLTPYVNITSPPNKRSKVICTDHYGYRFSHDEDGIIDSQSWFGRKHRALALGNSFMFGFGSTSDSTTVPSYLNARTRYRFLNLAVTASSSLQEVITTLPFLDQAELVLIGSGTGNLLHYLEFGHEYDLYGAFFGQEFYLATGQTDYRDIAGILGRDPAKSSSVPILSERTTETLRASIAAHPKPVMRWSEEEINQRFDLAVSHHYRDLRLLVRALPRGARILYAMQPTSSLAKSDLEAEEQALLNIYRHRPIWKNVFEPYVIEHLPHFTEAIRNNCDRLGVSFVDLNTIEYQGVCFMDYGHTTDHGNRMIADYLAGWIEGLPQDAVID